MKISTLFSDCSGDRYIKRGIIKTKMFLRKYFLKKSLFILAINPILYYILNIKYWEFPGNSVLRMLYFHSCGHGFNP